MSTCGVTRILAPAFFAGVAVSTLTGRDLFGWLAAALVAAALVVLGRVVGATASCRVGPQVEDDASAPPNLTGDALEDVPSGR